MERSAPKSLFLDSNYWIYRNRRDDLDFKKVKLYENTHYI